MKNTIMGSHENFCKELEIKVMSFSKYDLQEFINKNQNINNYSDYVQIYKSELKQR